MRVARAALLACAALAGCGDRKATPAPAARDAGGPDFAVSGPPLRNVLPPPTTRLAPPRVPMPVEKSTKLLAPGQAPRAVRRYQPVAEQRDVAIALAITTEVYRGGTVIGPTALPVVHEGFGAIVEPSPTGATVSLRGLAATVDAAPAADPKGAAEAEAYLARWRALVERRLVTVPIDRRGRAGAITLADDPSGARPGAAATRDELVQRWLGLAVPLPEEPIGVGARWEVVTLLRTGGAILKQTATYELTAIAPGAWTIALTTDRLGERQLIDVPGLPAGTTAELMALRRTVTGTLTLAPTSPVPRTATLTSASAAHARYTAPAGTYVEEASDDRATITITSTAPPP